MKTKFIQVANVRVKAELIAWYKPFDHKYTNSKTNIEEFTFQVIIGYVNGNVITTDYEYFNNKKSRDNRINELDNYFLT